MIKPVVMCSWHYDEEKKETVREIKGYLPGEFNDRGLLEGVLPNPFARPCATPELAMETVNKPQATPNAPVFHVE